MRFGYNATMISRPLLSLPTIILLPPAEMKTIQSKEFSRRLCYAQLNERQGSDRLASKPTVLYREADMYPAYYRNQRPRR